MAIKQCKECGNDVSTKAEACPKCGAVLKKKTSGCVGCLAIGIIGFIVLTVIGSFFTSNSPSTKNSKTDDVHGAWAYMQLFVEKRIKSPQSADFPFGGYRDVTALGSGRYKVDSYVHSQNSFGANSRTHFEGVIKKNNGGWELEYLNFR